MKQILIPITFLTVIIACKHSSRDSELPIQHSSANSGSEYIPNDPKAMYISTTQGLLDGKIIYNSKVPFVMTLEYDSSKTFLNETITAHGRKIINHYDADGKIIKLENYTNGELVIHEETKYNSHNDILFTALLQINIILFYLITSVGIKIHVVVGFYYKIGLTLSANKVKAGL